jgi:hypothetical protein
MNTKSVTTIFALLLVLMCCNKEKDNEYKSRGIITGPDIRACVCCGGWFIQIDSATYLFDTLPDNSNIDLQKETFPLPVKLDWQFANTYCTNSRIVIQRIKKE